MMNFELTSEQQMLCASMFDTASKLEAGQTFEERWSILANTGIFGTCVDKKYGGSGLGAIDMLLLLEALAKGNPDNGLSFAVAAHTLACVLPISEYASDELKQKYLPSLIDGTFIAANAMTETESGSDVYTMQCSASHQDGNYVLNGTKTFVSNCGDASLVLTYAKTDPDKGFFGGITAFVVEKGNYSIGAEFKKMGLESCSLGEIVFEEVSLPENAVVGKEGGGGMIFNRSMEWERICLTGIHLGAMERVLKKTVDFVKQRKSKGDSIGKFQAVSHRLAEMKVLLESSRNMAFKAAWTLDNKKSAGEEAAIAKLLVSTSVKDFMLKAMQIFGGYGYVADYGIEQEVRDALAATIYSGTSDIQKNIIALYLGIK